MNSFAVATPADAIEFNEFPLRRSDCQKSLHFMAFECGEVIDGDVAFQLPISIMRLAC